MTSHEPREDSKSREREVQWRDRKALGEEKEESGAEVEADDPGTAPESPSRAVAFKGPN